MAGLHVQQMIQKSFHVAEMFMNNMYDIEYLMAKKSDMTNTPRKQHGIAYGNADMIVVVQKV